MKRRVFIVVLLALCAAAGLTNEANAQVKIQVDVAKKGIEISPTLYGIFYEDINFASDGGLYAELIRNRSFEYNAETPEHWKAEGANISLVTEGLLGEKQGHALKVEVTKPGGGVSNEGYWGINVVAGTQYKLSFWIAPPTPFRGRIYASLKSKDGKMLGETVLSITPPKKGRGGSWQKVEANIVATESDPQAVFHLEFENPCSVLLDVVSLFPPTFKGRENGCRIDLAEKLQALHPAFMRFPGGCYVEGNIKPENAYHWERTVGPIERRPGHMNANWGYPTTDGLGFHEFLQLAEDLGAKPLYVVNIGIWHGGCTPLNELQPWIDECLGALEYANGPVTSHYGKMRAENGHPEPFGIAYIEIGNENYNYHMENNSDQSDHYPERYRMFYDAIKAHLKAAFDRALAALLAGADYQNDYAPTEPYTVECGAAANKPQETKFAPYGTVYYASIFADGWESRARSLDVFLPEDTELYKIQGCSACYVQCRTIKKGPWKGLK